jgi:hypothetical protein
MGAKNWISAKQAADCLGITKPQIFRLIKEKKIIATLEMDAPVPYYQVNKVSVEEYKLTPKNKGGRPSLKKVEQ